MIEPKRTRILLRKLQGSYKCQFTRTICMAELVSVVHLL